MNGDANAIRKLAAWQGGVDATVKSIVKNQDELERRVQALWASHSECREQTLTALTTLETTAKLEARKWGFYATLFSGIMVAIISTFIHFLVS